MPSVEETTIYFDRHAERLVRPHLVDKWAALAPLFADLKPQSRLLECGAGTGLYTIRLLEKGFTVLSVDLSNRSLTQLKTLAHERHLTSQLTTWQGEFLEFVSTTQEMFDAIVFIKVLHHFSSIQHIGSALEAAYTRLTPAGRLIGFEPNGDSILWKPWLQMQGKAVWENEQHVMLMRRTLLERIFVNLPQADYKFAHHYVIPGCILRFLPALARADRYLCQLPFCSRLALNLSFLVQRRICASYDRT